MGHAHYTGAVHSLTTVLTRCTNLSRVVSEIPLLKLWVLEEEMQCSENNMSMDDVKGENNKMKI